VSGKIDVAALPYRDEFERRFGAGDEGARLILVAGRPLDEPVFKYGPFVMNSKEEIIQAIHDYQNGTFSAAPAD